jgi:hypothetical protein
MMQVAVEDVVAVLAEEEEKDEVSFTVLFYDLS